MIITTAKEILPFACENDDSVLLSSDHGIGKSSIVAQYSYEQKFHFEPLFLSHQEVGDLIGQQKTKTLDNEEVTYWTKPEWFKRIEMNASKGIRSVLFLDELNRAPPDVLQCSLQLVLDGQIHDHKLPKGDLKTFIISAINPSSSYQTAELDPALLDRFLKLDIEISPQAWLDWAYIEKVNKNVTDFIENYPDFLHWTPEENEDMTDFDRCGTSPRSWVKVSGYVDLFRSGKLPEILLYNTLKGKLGSNVGHIFYSFLLTQNQICATDIIEIIDQLSTIPATHIVYAEQVKEFTLECEPIVKANISEQILARTLKGLDYKYILIYLYSLEIELVMPLLKTIKESHPKVYAELAKLDEVNNKELFRRIVNLIQ